LQVTGIALQQPSHDGPPALAEALTEDHSMDRPRIFRPSRPAVPSCRPVRGLAALALLLPIVLSATASAATWVVRPDGSGDVPDLQGAVAAAASGDTILLGPGTFTGAGNRALLILAKDLAFESMSGSDATTIDCEDLDRLMFVTQCSVVVSGITVRRGFAEDTGGGAIDAIAATITLRNSRFERNSGGGDPFDNGGGGAIHVVSGTLDVSECQFVRNLAAAPDGIGGAIAVLSGTDALVVDTVFQKNSTSLGQYAGGGGFLAWMGGNVTLERCTFRGNTTVEGGGVFLYSDTARLADCDFSGNTCTYAAQVTSGTPAVITSCTFADTEGGGLGIYNGAVVTDCTFARNVSDNWGGGAYSGGAPATFLRCTFADNWTSRAGGGIDLAGGNLTDLDHCTFVNNEAPIGGQIHTRGGAIVTLTHSILTGGVGAEGAVACDPGGTVNATCCDVFDNPAGDYVGGLAGQDGVNGNFGADPDFCDEGGGDYTLRSNSPCAPPGLTACGLIGAHPVGCGPVSVQPATWGSVKARFRH
jgi:Right handed beta helix region